MKASTYFVCSLFLLFASCKSKDVPQYVSYKTVVAFRNLTFSNPVDLQNAGDSTNRMFVVEQAGMISVFPNDSATTNKTTFLDITSKVQSAGGEQGLLGLAFHPQYKANGYFYVNYTATNPERTVVSRFKVSSDPNIADPNSEQLIITYLQPFSNHNGGQLAFGKDGFLYIAVGDGGSGGDPFKNGQNREVLLGKILRLDVDKEENNEHYGIPADNPFAGNTVGYRQEIYAYGLRNPWRFSFDSVTGHLWAGDVGQDLYEEIDNIDKGGNYGWNDMEGAHCYPPGSSCEKTGRLLPIWEYGRNYGLSVIGGYVYRGSTLQPLSGKYIYGDYGSRRIWALDFSDLAHPTNTGLVDADFSFSSFGVDQNNELYICGFDGKIHRLKGQL